MGISHSYRLAWARLYRNGGQRTHIVQCEHFPPGMGPHARKRMLCGAQVTAFPPQAGREKPGGASCPACRRALAELLAAAAALITDRELVTCPDGCTRPGSRPVPCDPVYAGAGSPYATGAFRCPLCHREHTPETTQT